MIKITLPQPKVLPGQRVIVHNYRSKPKDGRQVWEYGRCGRATLGLSTDMSGRKMYKHWSYEVVLDRRSRSKIKYGQEYGNSTVSLTVGDDGIKLA